MSLKQPLAERIGSAAMTRSMRAYWGLFLTEGISVGILGLAAIVVPTVAGIFATVVFGWLFLIAGIVGLAATLRVREAPGFGWSLLSALVAVVAGGVLLWNPLGGLITLTYVLITFFVADGILVILLALAHRRNLSGKWEWMMVNGIIDLILAGIVIFGFPAALVWAFGLLVGIDMIFGGASLIAVALEAREAPRMNYPKPVKLTDLPLFGLLFACGLAACSPNTASFAEAEYPSKIVGTWQGKVRGTNETISFGADGEFVSLVRPGGFISMTLSQGVTGKVSGTWTIKGKSITLKISGTEHERVSNSVTMATIETLKPNELLVKSNTGVTSMFLRLI